MLWFRNAYSSSSWLNDGWLTGGSQFIAKLGDDAVLRLAFGAWNFRHGVSGVMNSGDFQKRRRAC